MRGVVTQSPEPEAHVLCVRAFGSNWNLEVLVFEERGKPLGAEREPTTNLAHI